MCICCICIDVSAAEVIAAIAFASTVVVTWIVASGHLKIIVENVPTNPSIVVVLEWMPATGCLLQTQKMKQSCQLPW